MKRVRFIFRSQNRGRPTTKGYDLYFGAKNPKGYDYSTRCDYSASAGNFGLEKITSKSELFDLQCLRSVNLSPACQI